MKMILTICILLMTFSPAFAPLENVIYLADPSAIQPYEKIWSAICFVESDFDSLAYNSTERAYGIAQIRDIRLRDYNARSGDSLSLNDCFSPQISKKVFMFYCQIFGPYDMDNMVRAWNGSGVATFEYLRKVKKQLYKN